MIEIMLVDDDVHKTQKISEVIYETLGEQCVLETERDVVGAKRKLKERKFDLLLLDIKLPNRIDKPADINGGVELMRWIKGPGKLSAPRHLIGITAHEEAFRAANGEFDNFLWTLVKFDASKSDWKHKLAQSLLYLAAQETPPYFNNGKSYRCDLGILVALEDVELRAVLNLPGGWQEIHVRNDLTKYHRGSFSAPGRDLSVVVASAPNKGMPHAAVCATKLIYSFWPKVLAMPGICAGVKGRVDLGDVIVADPCWDWGSGKIRMDSSGAVEFSAAPYQQRLASVARSAAVTLKESTEILRSISNDWDRSKKAPPKVHIGPWASGGSVLGSSTEVQKIIDQHKDLLAIEMEAFAVMLAADLCPRPPSTAIVIKGVSDFGGKDKNKKALEPDRQEYAAYTSARALYHLVVNSLELFG